jgi:hypothetical protein
MVPMVNIKIGLGPSKVLWTIFGIVLEGPNGFEKKIGLKRQQGATSHHHHHWIPQFHVQRRSDFRRTPL